MGYDNQLKDISTKLSEIISILKAIQSNQLYTPVTPVQQPWEKYTNPPYQTPINPFGPGSPYFTSCTDTGEVS